MLSFAAPILPSMADLAYGDEPAQRLDIYKPSGSEPFPVVVFIHGGGWQSGDKKWFMSDPDTQRFLSAGIAVVSINYRMLGQAQKDGLFPPVLGPSDDARRALQTIRYHAKEWGLAASDIALSGESAGGCTALWLALSPDMAKPNSSDPVDRMSTRVVAVGVRAAQTTLDPLQIHEWVPETSYGARAFGMSDASKADFEAFLQKRPELEKYFATVSPAALLGPYNPPIYLAYGKSLDDPKKDDNYYIHSPEWGIGFQKLAQEKGAICLLEYKGKPAAGNEKHDIFDFLIHYLKRVKGPNPRQNSPRS